MYQAKDRTYEFQSGVKDRTVGPEDYCVNFKLNKKRLLSQKTCWNCIYGNFNFDIEMTTDEGTCNFKYESNN